MTTAIGDIPQAAPSGFGARALRWSKLALVAATWVSGAIFGVYILAFFGGTAVAGMAQRWNESLPALHDAGAPLATIAIGAHFLAGGILLLLGPIQLMGGVRRAAPALHRWLGRVYVVSAGLAGVGGLGYIMFRGTIGGPLMSLGFGAYGALMIMGSVLTYTNARARRFEAHRAWAIRLFALTVGSWLYRIDYGFWFLLVGRAGHTSHFTGWFDHIMVFFFYIPNLLIAELAIRGRGWKHNAPLTFGSAVVFFATATFVTLATWSFTTSYWWPGIVSGLTGAPL